MKLLIFTQKVDKNDSVLGFFHSWLIELSKISESVSVICLESGSFDLPENVKVYSLGKEHGASRLGYVANLYHYLHILRGSYDRVFVHMNQEYVLLAGLYWKLKNISVYLWRNHPKGSFLTRIAIFLSTKVFTTSTDSFTARFSKTVIMPAGVDANMFKIKDGVSRLKYSVCMVGRVSPIKHIELALSTIKNLVSFGTQVSLSIIGPISENDLEYYDLLKNYVTENRLSGSVRFVEAVSQAKLPEIFSEYEICLNLTESGSFDKTIVEAAACGAIPIVSNVSLAGLLPTLCVTQGGPEAIGASIQKLFEPHQRVAMQQQLEIFVKSQSLNVLMEKLVIEMEK